MHGRLSCIHWECAVHENQSASLPESSRGLPICCLISFQNIAGSLRWGKGDTMFLAPRFRAGCCFTLQPRLTLVLISPRGGTRAKDARVSAVLRIISFVCPLPPHPLGRIVGSFIVKRKTGFQIGIRIGADMHSFFWGIRLRRSWLDYAGGLLGSCLE